MSTGKISSIIRSTKSSPEMGKSTSTQASQPQQMLRLTDYFMPFPTELVNSEAEKKAILVHLACSDAVA
jgi:hypothetical protein